jgi:hypothetical protein
MAVLGVLSMAVPSCTVPPPPAVAADAVPSENGNGDRNERMLAFEWFTNDEAGDGSVVGVAPLDGSSPPEALQSFGERRYHWPRPSPDGSQIAYASDVKGHRGNLVDEYWIADIDGSNPTRILSLTPGDEQNNELDYVSWGHLEWSPDGTEFLFAAQVAGERSFSIHKSGIDGTGHTRLTDGTQYSIDPSWHPDGRIVFIRIADGLGIGYQEPWIMNGDGSGQTQLSDDTAQGRPEQPDWDPVVSPDGQRLGLLRMIELLRWDNAVSDLDGSDWMPTADGSEVPGAGYSEPAWVTDDQIVVARSNIGGTQIVSYDPDDPAEKTVVLAGDMLNHYRAPAPYLAT